MTKLPLIAVATLMVAGGLVAPAFAATTVPAGHVPLCAADGGPALDAQKDALAAELQLSTKLNASIDVWNGCLQVTTMDAGKTTVAYYDPNTLRLIAEV